MTITREGQAVAHYRARFKDMCARPYENWRLYATTTGVMLSPDTEAFPVIVEQVQAMTEQTMLIRLSNRSAT